LAEDTSSTTTTTVTTVSGKVPVEKRFFVGVGGHATDVTFSFTASPTSANVGTAKNGLEIKQGPALATPTVTYTYTSAMGANSEGYAVENNKEFDFSSILTGSNAVTSVGIYQYTVTETIPAENSEHITQLNPYDDTADPGKYTVDVYVINDPKDATKLAIGAINITYDNYDEKPDKLLFENACDTTSLTIKKQVEGNAGEKDREYKFWLCIPEGGITLHLTEGTKYDCVIYDAEGNKKADTRTSVTVAGDYDKVRTLTEAFTYNEFTLSDGEYMVIENVPVGMTYYIREEVCDGYTTKMEYTHLGNSAVTSSGENETTKQRMNIMQGQLNNQKNLVVYVNEKTLKVDTGVPVEILPYILIVAVALAGCLVLLFKKRRTVR
jgi:hypothetical protein